MKVIKENVSSKLEINKSLFLRLCSGKWEHNISEIFEAILFISNVLRGFIIIIPSFFSIEFMLI